MGRRDVDPLPPVELWDAEETRAAPVPVTVGGGAPRRVPILVAAAVALLAVAGLLLGGSGDGDGGGDTPPEERDNRARSSLDHPTTTTVRRATTTTSTTAGPVVLGPVFAEPTGAALLVPARDVHWTWLDLDSGRRQDVTLLADDPYGIVPVRSGVVVPRAGSAWYQPLPEGEAVDLGPSDQVLSSGLTDAVWLVRSGPNSGLPPPYGTSAHLVGLDGAERATVAVPQLSYAFAAVPDGLVFGAGGRTYLAGVEGVRPLADGDLLGAAGSFVVVLTCDDAAVCSPRVLDVATGRSRRLPPTPNPMQSATMVLPAEDGRVAILRFDESPGVTLYDVTGKVYASGDALISDSSPRWLPAGLGLVSVGPGGAARYTADGTGSIVREAIAVLRDWPSDEVVYVIPG